MSGKNLKIDKDNFGRRIDNYLFNIYKSLPKSKIYSMIRKGEIRVNSGRIKPTYKLALNDEIRIPPYLIDFKNAELDLKIPPSRIKAFVESIIYQNDDYIVVNKEPELSVHSGTNNQFGLIDIARAKFPLLEIDLCIARTQDGKPFTHIHCCWSDDGNTVHAGHMFSSTIAVVAEIHLRIMSQAIMTRCPLADVQLLGLQFS